MAGSSSQNTHELNYVTANRFYVEIESAITACFSECQGLGVSIRTEKIHEGGVNEQQRVILGQPEFSDVTLKRGVTNDLVFWTWIGKNILDDSVTKKQRRNVNILVFNQGGQTMQCWTLIGAVPVAWKAPSLAAHAATAAIEELTLAYEGLKVVTSGGGGATILPGRDGKGFFG